MSDRIIIAPGQQGPPVVAPAGVTPNGLPYPESTAPLNQGANDIKALATALDPTLKVDPFVWVARLGSQVNAGTYLFQLVKSDPRAGWNLANGWYVVPVSGYYQALVHVQTNGSGGWTVPEIQTATTTAGPWTTQLAGANVSSGAWSGNTVSGIMPLNAGNGVRCREANNAWTADNTTDGANFFQLAYLGMK